MLAPREGGTYIDATFGAGGYTRLILQSPGTRVIGIDRDSTAIAGGAALVAEAGARLTLVENRFSAGLLLPLRWPARHADGGDRTDRC